MAPPLTADDIAFVTGLDSNFFVTGVGMIGSFESLCPGRSVLVCDFGLNEAHRGFLAARGTLLERPAGLPASAEPLAKKTALAGYLGARQPRAVVWIDADAMLVHPVVDRIVHLLEVMEAAGTALAICEDDLIKPNIEAFFSAWAERYDLSGFRTLLHRRGVQPTLHRYLNTGFFICRDLSFLSEWQELGASVPHFFLFDQNIAQVLIYHPSRLHMVLDTDEWNAHCGALGRANAWRLKPPLRIVHAAGSYFAALKAVRYSYAGLTFSGIARAFDNPELQARQLRHIQEYILRHSALLARHGVLQ
jgi:hypothetical protein